jgi:hypothetical protein
MAVQSCIRGRLQLHRLYDVSQALQRVYMRGVRTGLFVDLDGGLVGVDSNDLAYEVVVTNTDLGQLAVVHSSTVRSTYKFVHGTSDHVLGDDDRTGESVCDLSAAVW